MLTRKAQFQRAIGLRLRAERAAAAALEPKTALRWAIETGDQHRRIAQDLLFIDQVDARKRADEELGRADEQYQFASDHVDACDLVSQIQAELPFLGPWYIRHSARTPRTDSTGAGDSIDRTIAEMAHDLDEKLKAKRPAPKATTTLTASVSSEKH